MTSPEGEAGHLLPLSHGWSLWKDFLLRSAGFPVGALKWLASSDAAKGVDELLRLEQAVREAVAAADEVCARAQREVHGPPWRALAAIRKALKSGNYAKLGQGSGPEAESLEAVRRAVLQLQARATEVEQLFEQENLRLCEELRAIARQERFREAIIWQNRQGYHTGVKVLLNRPITDRGSSTRGKERLVASYVQRYCAKNDSIGFFGPTAWGKFQEAGDAISVHPGPDIIGARRTFLEQWALDELAATISALPGIQPWLAPRRMPYVRIAGQVLHTPLGADELSPLQARVLSACDGERTARAIARDLLADTLLSVPGEAEVYKVLEDFVSQGLLLWRLEVPTVGRTTLLDVLHRQLERIEDGSVRQQAFSMLGELEAARDEVSRAAGNPEAVDEALGKAEATFTRLTGKVSTRNAGQLYAARTMIYEDCRRDVSVAAGPALRERLAPTLTALLTAGRWLTYHVASDYRTLLMDIYRELQPQSGSDPVELAQFWATMAPYFPVGGGSLPDSVRATISEFQHKWARLFRLPSQARRLELSAQELLPQALELFSAPGPGWPTARYHSPDIMLAAPSVEAIARGDYQIVLGELHMGVNSLEQEIFLDDHPNPKELLDAMAVDLRRGRVTPTIPTAMSSSRMAFGVSQHPDDATLEFEGARSFRPRAQTLSIGDLVVQERGGHLIIRTRDGSKQWDIIAFLDCVIADATVSLLPAAPHMPRITLDGVVVWRESWSFTPEELAFAHRETPLERFKGVRELARTRNLPRFLFAKVSAEKKPIYLDLESPVYVEIFTQLVRRSTTVSVGEMLPEIDQCWLSDSEKNTYTSELRIIAVDDKHWQPPS
jgi:hypothetical protein